MNTFTLRVFGLAVVVAFLGACRKQSSEPEKTTTVHSYTVRGQVASVPVAGDPRTEFQVRHEAIPEFKGPGDEVGMDTMTMPFPLRDGVSLEGIAVGDKVEVTFEVIYDLVKKSPVDWDAVSVKELPAETALDFSPLPERAK
jgi:Cu/Ag efflux protein CusF